MHALPRTLSARYATIALQRGLNLATLLAFSFATLSLSASPSQPIQVPMAPESFVLSTPNGSSATSPQFVEHLGREAVDLPSGLLNVKDSKMRDGIIDVDIATKPNALFAGIAFRTESDANLEMVYIRPGLTDTLEAMQYTPRLNGDAIWQLLNTNHEKASAHFPKDQWFHIKLVVSGRTCVVFMNNSPDPAMTVTNLRRGDSEGAIGLWGLGGGAYFSNLSYTPAPDRTQLADLPPFQEAGVISHWELSAAFDAADVDATTYPTSISQWDRVQAEDPGFVLINRYRTSPAIFPMPPREEMQKGRVKGAKVVFARAHVASGSAADKILTIGYSDDIVVYLNGKQVFSGKNALGYRSDDALGVFGLNDQVPIHLNPGDNQLLVAVTEYNGGWAFECKLSQ
ncbi:family 16 glycoside hydrolase [Occallatibacter savannae]|uniref:family 16 glycoside hydrolase n=1 Tax=Occallatibacter savannae TaxID=1002691 RepID=UPI000D69FCC4|nr:family 16 glycoside hydrolase [Occallatibacter savannae]